MYAFGKVMRRLIEERGTSQADISRVTGINKQNVSLICNGKTRYPSIQVCKKLAVYFDMTLDELWELVAEEEGE
jgi:transcriptional regulator with XRE-family HTH domain